MRQNRFPSILICLLILSPAAALTKTKNLNPNSNPPQYAAFSKPLGKQEQLRHALNRLTFGPRPGDLEALKRTGMHKWVNAQLSPDQIPENPVLAQRLKPLESLPMSIHQTYVRYPSPQVIAAVARGRGTLPDDPELRTAVVRLAGRYLKKHEADASSSQVGSQGLSQNLNDDADLDPKLSLSEILSSDEIDTLRNGKPEQKKQVLASIPSEKRLDFVWALRPEQRRQLLSVAPVSLRRDLMLSMNPQNVVASDLTEAKLLRAIYSDRQLEELLVDFWFNHFNVFIGKGGDRYMVPSYEREAIRPYVLGNFYDLLLATAQSPAMLFYLDNWQSVAADSAGPGAKPPNPNQKAKRGLNENYGRELLELHTLGVDGGYTQKDVIEVARCFTGWTIASPRKGGGFDYNDKVHDKGEKIVLGQVIPAGGGIDDGLAVLNILVHRPSTAHFISLKLAQRFVADDPPPSLVNRMAQVFRETQGDLREVTKTMLTSPEFWSQGAYRAKVKSPLEMVVSAVRATNANVDSAFPLANELQRLGEPAYRKVEPTGYSSANAEWVSSAGLLERMNFALALSHNKLPGVSVDTTAWQVQARKNPLELAHVILGQSPSEPTKKAIKKTLSDPQLQKQLTANAKSGKPQVPALIVALAIGSPEFQRR
ncbi:MAG: DUF1800 domain-containing protein [Acidobacteriaceae bacterium]|nr:DUF1800 domain-containing protein [Acidobacteriaceae bacterium]MBV9778687.1 DUF1800 domain-containing protein [Acidobacteriaceae bacterium]